MPYASKAQQRAMHAKATSGEIPQSVVDEFDKATKQLPGGFESLPDKKKKKKEAEKKAALLRRLARGTW